MSEMTHPSADPDVYVLINDLPRRYNLLVLDVLQDSFVSETKGQQFLDVGCGTGDFTREHLLPRCPLLEKMVAVDVSRDMVEYAQKNFPHPKIRYDVLDISQNDVTGFVKRYGHFDRVYSFFCLHWMKDQGRALKNISGLLKPGGGCLLLFGASGGVLRLNKALSTMGHWQRYREIFEKTIPSSVDLKDRNDCLSYMMDLLKRASLIPTTCEVLQMTHTHPSIAAVTRLYMVVNCISTIVTEEEKPLLLKDVAEVAAKMWAEEDPLCPSNPPALFLVRAHKPLS